MFDKSELACSVISYLDSAPTGPGTRLSRDDFRS